MAHAGWCKEMTTSTDTIALLGHVEFDAMVQAIGEAICTLIIVVVVMRSMRTNSLVLPIYKWILLAYFAVSLGHCIKLSLLGYDGLSAACAEPGPGSGSCGISVVLEGAFWAGAHVVLEGVSCLLCMRGAGKRSFSIALGVGIVWGGITWAVVSSYASGWRSELSPKP